MLYFAPRAERENGGVQCPWGFSCVLFGGHLPQISARSKQYLRVIFVRLLFIRQNFHDSWCRFNGIKPPSMKARTKVLASFEAGMNSPNFPWHVNITSLKHRSRFGEVPCFRQVELFNSQMQAFFGQFCFFFAKIFKESCVEKYKEFNGLNFSSTRARTNVLASCSLKAGMNSRSL